MAHDATLRPWPHAAQDVDISASSKASVPLIQLIMRQIYNLVIEDPNKLNDYRGFSEEVWSLHVSTFNWDFYYPLSGSSKKASL
jgi:hypothetical protein